MCGERAELTGGRIVLGDGRRVCFVVHRRIDPECDELVAAAKQFIRHLSRELATVRPIPETGWAVRRRGAICGEHLVEPFEGSEVAHGVNCADPGLAQAVEASVCVLR